MKKLKLITLFIALSIITISACSQRKAPVDADGRPLIVKRGTIDVGIIESTPIVFNNKLYRFEYIRGDVVNAKTGNEIKIQYWDNKTNSSYFRFIDYETGEPTESFAKGYHFGSAAVFNDSVYVTGSNGWGGNQIHLFASNDMKNWENRLVFELPGYTLYNTSLTRDNDKYVLMFEVGDPEEIAGERFTALFATSTDLINWKILSKDHNYAKDRYTAPHALRFLDGYYYNFYLEVVTDGFEMRVVRSKDFINWESSPLNPVLKSSEDDRKIINEDINTEEYRKLIAEYNNTNNSDIDFCEFNGKLFINYCWGDQQHEDFLAEAYYEGTLKEFLKGWFPEEIK